MVTQITGSKCCDPSLDSLNVVVGRLSVCVHLNLDLSPQEN